MIRTTITLPADLARLVAREARRRGTSVSAVVRDALMRQTGLAAGQPRPLPFAGLGRSGRRHTARHAERILGREWHRVRDR